MKFKLSEEEIHYVVHQEILPFFKVVKSKPSPSITKEDSDDDKFIQCAKARKAKVIISGDRHLLALKSHHCINILATGQFLERL
jgi:predicted nucleic acid-binding protein